MSEVSLLRINNYSEYFFNKARVLDSKYLYPVADDDYERFCILGGDTEEIDTPLEISLLSYYSQPVLNIRPVEAQGILPANSRTSSLKLGAAVYKELVELRFLDPRNTAAIGRYEGMLKFITDRNGVSRTEIEGYYRQGIGGLIAETVDAEFNKISFLLDNDKYNAILTRNAQNQYVLSYEGYFNGTRSKKELSATSLETLLASLSRSGDFSQAAIGTVRTQAALIPAVVYADWKARGVAQGADALALITEAITNFYLNPNQTTYTALTGIYARYASLVGDPFAEKARIAFVALLDSLHPELSSGIINNRDLVAAARVPNDSRYRVFSTPYAVNAHGVSHPF